MGNDIEHMETSAKDNSNVNQAFARLAQKALLRQQYLQKKTDEGTGGANAAERERLKKLKKQPK